MALLSPLANLFILIQERIKATVPAVQWIDQDFGQMDFSSSEYRPPVKFPCVLIDLVGFSYEDVLNGTQTANGKVILRLSTAPVANSNQVTPLPQKEKALEFYELEYVLSKNLHFWQPAGFSRLLKRSLDKMEREDTLRERVLVFDISFTDTTAAAPTVKVSRPNPVVGGDIRRENG